MRVISVKHDSQIIGTIAKLASRFPAGFFVSERRRKPLKIGIEMDILSVDINLAIAAARTVERQLTQPRPPRWIAGEQGRFRRQRHVSSAPIEESALIEESGGEILRSPAESLIKARIDRKNVKLAMAHYYGSAGYLRSLIAGAVRVDLNGHSAGIVSPAEAAEAAAKLDGKAAAVDEVAGADDSGLAFRLAHYHVHQEMHEAAARLMGVNLMGVKKSDE